MCLDLVPELSLWACCSDVRGDVLGGLGAVGGLSERSTKIRKIRHIGRLLLACILCLLCFLEHLGFYFRNSFFARELVDLMFCSTPLFVFVSVFAIIVGVCLGMRVFRCFFW